MKTKSVLAHINFFYAEVGNLNPYFKHKKVREIDLEDRIKVDEILYDIDDYAEAFSAEYINWLRNIIVNWNQKEAKTRTILNICTVIAIIFLAWFIVSIVEIDCNNLNPNHAYNVWNFFKVMGFMHG